MGHTVRGGSDDDDDGDGDGAPAVCAVQSECALQSECAAGWVGDQGCSIATDGWAGGGASREGGVCRRPLPFREPPSAVGEDAGVDGRAGECGSE